LHAYRPKNQHILKSGDNKEKVRVQDIAEILKISASTVSRALNDHPRISRETKEKVLQTAKRLGYRSGIPQLLSPEKAEAVAVLVPSIEQAMYRDIISGVNDYLSQYHFQTFTVDTKGDEDRSGMFFATYKKYGISGIIHIVCNRKIPEDFFAVPQKDALPLVTVFEPDHPAGISSVVPDMFQGIDKIAGYLKSQKISPAVLILENENKPEDFQIVSDFRSAAEMLETDNYKPEVLYAGKSGTGLAKQLEMLFSRSAPPQIILVKNTLTALEVMNFARQKGLKIPDDLLLIAIDSNHHHTALTLNLSLLKLPAYSMGQEAAKMLLRQIIHPETERMTSVKPVKFILKGSAIRIK